MNLNNKKILVTGGAGFIGSTLVHRLVNEGAKVYVVDNLWRGKLENLVVQNSYIIDIEKQFYLADLTDMAKCLELLRDFDVVYHLADIVAGISYIFGHEQFVFRQNILMNSNVLAACFINKIPNYIYVGTACSYPKYLQMSSGITILSEDQTYPAEPESAYGWSKLMGEYEAQIAKNSGQINIGLLRLHNVFGPKASYSPDRSQVIPSLIRKAVRFPQEKFVVWGSGNQYRDFIYVDDVVDALIQVLYKGMNKGVIQIGSEKPITIREASELIVQISGKPIEAIYDTKMPEGDLGRISKCDRAREILQWSPKISFYDGLQRTYRWVESQISNSKR